MALLWLLAVTGLALTASRAQIAHIQSLLDFAPEHTSSLQFAVGTIAVPVLLALFAGSIWPTWWRRLSMLLAMLPAPVLLVTSGNVAAGGAALLLFLPACWLGREVLGRLLQPLDRGTAWVVGSAGGVLLLAGLGFALGRAAILQAQAIWLGVVAVTLLALLLGRRRVYDDVTAFLSWLTRPVVRSVERLLLSGALIGYFWLALVGALAPEIMSDAVRQRLAAAALFARTGRLTGHPDLSASLSPGLGEIVYAVALTVGPPQTAKILNFLIGMLCVAGVATLGRRLGGGRAALVAAVAFATLPLTTWLAQTAYTDLFALLFAVTAAVLLVLREQLDWRVVGVTLILLGAGSVVKSAFSLIAVGLLVAMLLLVVWRGGKVATALTVGAVALSMLFTIVAVLSALIFALARIWSTQSLALLSAAPRLSLLVEALAQTLAQSWTQALARMAGFASFGTERSLLALLRSPVALTIDSQAYSEYLNGFTGYLPLALAPLTVVAKRHQRCIIVGVAVVTGYILWFSSTQYLRYALPLLALCAALGGAAYSATQRQLGNRAASAGMTGLLVILIGLGALGYLNTVLLYPGEVPFRVVLGRQTTTDYLTRKIDAYTALRLLDAEPRATRALAYESAQFYTRVPLSSIYYAAGLQDERTLLQFLDRQGYSHILVERATLGQQVNELTVTTEEFLRRNTLLVGGDRGAYLYRLLPPGERGRDQPWTRGPELVANGGFEKVAGTAPADWRGYGQPVLDDSGNESRTNRRAVRVTTQDAFFTIVQVTPNVRYLLTHATRSAEGEAQARLQINWSDSAGQVVGVTIEVIQVSPRGYHLRSLLATAPANAASAAIYAQAQQGTVWYDDVSLRAVGADASGGKTFPPVASRAPLVIRQVQPARTKVGVGFNVRSDGQSVLIVECKNALPSTVVVVNGTPWYTEYIDWRRLAIIVPAYFYAEPGRLSISIRDETGESDRVAFAIDP